MSGLPRLVAATSALALAGAGAVAAGGAAQAASFGGEHTAHQHSTHHARHHAPPRLRQGVLASGLFTPLSAAVADDGTAYVTSSFAGQILKVRPGQAPTVAYSDPDGYEIEGLSADGPTVTFLVTHPGAAQGENLDSWVKELAPDGTVHTLADLHDYEADTNPDQGTTYGFRDGDPACDAQWPAQMGPAAYPGHVDSHPYASVVSHGTTYVADAGANAVFAVSPRGRVRTVATLPAAAHTISADEAAGLGLDACFAGRTYYFEGVPTDVELGPDGRLVVTSLPGGPEGDQLGARGAVYSVDVGSGRTRRLADGFAGATGVAVSPSGTLYVAEMFGNRITRVSHGHRSTLASPPTPGAVEWTRWGVVATTDVLSGTDGTSAPAGQLVDYGH